MTKLPAYFQPGETNDSFYHSVGGSIIYSTLVISGFNVSYSFCDGNRTYNEAKGFKSENKAIQFASSFAAEMNRCDKRQTVPSMDKFRNW